MAVDYQDESVHVVTSSRGRIRMNIHFDYFKELAQFSHIWVLFIFHENTNDSTSHHAKVMPPRLGQRVGCLSTRSPHRPNPIGLSVCHIDRVNEKFIEISQLDMVHGTPVIDIKPYIPYDIIPCTIPLPMLALVENELHSLIVPSWIFDSDIVLRKVLFTDSAKHKLDTICAQQPLLFSENSSHAMRLIEQVLTQDIRGIHQGRGSVDGKRLYECRLDNVRLEFITDEDRIIVQNIFSCG